MGLAKGNVYSYHRSCRGIRFRNYSTPKYHAIYLWLAESRSHRFWNLWQCLDCVWLSIHIIGLRSPLKFSPILLLQLSYKVVWFIGIILPALIAGKFPAYAMGYVVFFAVYIIGDLIAIPFSYVFAKQSDR